MRTAHRRRRSRWIPTGAWLALLGLLSAPFPGMSQTLIGRVSSGQILTVDLERSITTDRIVVEVDGRPLTGTFRTRGDILEVLVPDDLQGVRHDLRVYVLRGDGREELGVWLFETDNAPQSFSGSVQADAGLRATRDETGEFVTGTIRLETDQGEGQVRGRLLLSRDEDSGAQGRDEISVDDLFLELRRPFAGNDLFFRLGNSDVLSNTILLNEESRRGLTLRLADPGGEMDISAFVLGTERTEGLENVLGLEDAGALVSGLSGIFRPQAIPGMRLDLALFGGHSRDLPDGGNGTVEGYGIYGVLPFADGRADLSLGVSQTDWEGTSGSAAEAALNWRLSEPGDVDFLAFGIEASRIDSDFFSPLNPYEIRGETGVTVFLDSIDPTWQWRLETYLSKTNTNGAPENPVDRLSGVSANMTFDPGDFTGGFFNGTLFFADASIDLQDRMKTPPDAPGAEDNTFATLSFGMEKLQPRYNWAGSVALDTLNDRAQRGADQRSAFVAGRLSLTPTPDTTAQLFVNTGRRISETEGFNETEASFSMDHRFPGGLWQAGISGGYLYTEDEVQEDGRFVSASLTRRLNEKFELVARANWGRDRYVPYGVRDEGWSIELFLRTDFSFNRN